MSNNDGYPSDLHETVESYRDRIMRLEHLICVQKERMETMEKDKKLMLHQIDIYEVKLNTLVHDAAEYLYNSNAENYMRLKKTVMLLPQTVL